MHKTFMSTGCYIQGPGSLDLVGEKAATLGKRPALVCDAGVRNLIEDRLSKSFAAAKIAVETYPFAGEITVAVIESLTAQARADAIDVVIGAGGGKALDAAKGVARRLSLPFISVPTIASTDAPAARGLVVYDDDHRVVAVEQMERNPDFVIVDTEVIAKAPPQFLRAGIGDAISKRFEAQGCWSGTGFNKHRTRPTKTAIMIADACYDIVRQHGAAAMRAAQQGKVTDDLEYVVEAAVLLSTLAFENGGLSIAHALAPPLGLVRGACDALHGEHVAYATLVQMTTERRPDAEIEDVRAFLRDIGLPVSLRDLGLPDPTDAEIAELARATVANPHVLNQPRPVTVADLDRAIREVEAPAVPQRAVS
jgi:glycerol dehydrogenase